MGSFGGNSTFVFHSKQQLAGFQFVSAQGIPNFYHAFQVFSPALYNPQNEEGGLPLKSQPHATERASPLWTWLR